MKHYVIFTVMILLIFSILVQSQIVTVINKDTNIPVNKVRVYFDDLEIYTDVNGRANLLDFIDYDSITISHDDYLDLTTSWANLEKSGFIVSLEPLETGLEIVISASGWQENIREITNRVETVNQESISFTNPQTSADLLKAAEGVFVQKSQLGGGSPIIRGFAANRVLIAVDGMRMNNAIFRGGNLQNVISLDAASLERTEVVFGPGSIIYGSDAIGGVMNFITLDPSFSNSDELLWSGNSLMRWSSSSRESTLHFHSKAAKRNWAIASSFSFSNFNDLRMGSNGPDELLRLSYADSFAGQDSVVVNRDPAIQTESGFNQYNFLLKAKYKFQQNLLGTYTTIFSHSSNIPRYDRLIQAKGPEYKYAQWYYGPQHWMLNSLGLEYRNIHPLFSSASLTLATQNFRESRNDRKFNSQSLRERKEEVDVLSINLDLRKQISEKESFYYGLEGVLNNVSSLGKENNILSGLETEISSRYPDDSSWSSLAAYLSYKNRFTDSITLHSGFRYNRVGLKAEFEQKFYSFPFSDADLSTDAINGSLGLAWQLSPSIQLNFNTSTGFRAPNIDDVGKIFDSEPGNVVVPNPDLKPEYAWNTDLTLISYLGEGSRFELTGFYTKLTDAMVRRDFSFAGKTHILYDGELSRVQAVQNADSATVKGVQAGLVLKLAALIQLKSSLNYTHGETADGFALRHVPPTFGDLHLVYSGDKFKVDLFAEFSGEISYTNLALSERAKTHIYLLDKNGKPYSPAWTTLNIRSSYMLSEKQTLFFGIDNLLDRRYRPYSSGIVASGINLSFALSTNF